MAETKSKFNQNNFTHNYRHIFPTHKSKKNKINQLHSQRFPTRKSYKKHLDSQGFPHTQIQHLWRSGRVSSSRWRLSAGSDVLRLALLFRFGGAYLDTDVVSLAPLPEKPLSFVAAEDDAGRRLNCAVCRLQKGNRFALRTLQYLVRLTTNWFFFWVAKKKNVDAHLVLKHRRRTSTATPGAPPGPGR